MFTDLIKKITIVCPDCKTTIQFDVPTDATEMTTLINQINSFTCPRCKVLLVNKVTFGLQAVQKYNASVLEIINLQKERNIKLD